MNDLIPIIVPKENVNDETVTVVAWYFTSRQQVERGQAIAQIETSKTVLDVEAPASGILRDTVAVGEEVAIGGTIGWITPVATEPEDGRRNGEAKSSAEVAEVAPLPSPPLVPSPPNSTTGPVARDTPDGAGRPRGTRFTLGPGN